MRARPVAWPGLSVSAAAASTRLRPLAGTSLYVAGGFKSPTASFGSNTLTNADASGNSNDVFLVKLTDAGSTGSVAWAQRAGGTDDDAGIALLL
ncbi:hypothetical protein [Hymenobacter negativus]|uniref:Uncharacterized protein n=1 Tax=Hymenobacter negativus TaxID=2795026 RepID=A0ABS3QG78_9BACT|nr:hypothetical protein [Hymenobacter negativus]MBO2010264.1 hypothetical protein [Hymenobacter negativus]